MICFITGFTSKGLSENQCDGLSFCFWTPERKRMAMNSLRSCLVMSFHFFACVLPYSLVYWTILFRGYLSWRHSSMLGLGLPHSCSGTGDLASVPDCAQMYDVPQTALDRIHWECMLCWVPTNLHSKKERRHHHHLCLRHLKTRLRSLQDWCLSRQIVPVPLPVGHRTWIYKAS